MHFLPPNQQRQSTEGTTAAQKQHLSEQVTLRGSRLLTDVVDVAATLDILGYSEPAPDCGCCDFDFFSASCSDNAIAVSISRHKVNITLHHLPLRHTQQSRRDQTERNVLLSCRIQQYVTVSLINSIVLHQPSDQHAGLRHRRAPVQITVTTLSGNSLRQTVHTHCASVHQAAKLVAALLRVVGGNCRPGGK